MNTTGLVHLTVLDSILCLISLLSFILMVVSASLCGVALRCCGGQCICSGGDPEKDCCMVGQNFSKIYFYSYFIVKFTFIISGIGLLL